MIAKCEIKDKDINIISQPYSVRAIVRGDKVVFSVNDILYACGIKAPRKWVERNADKFSWMWADSYPYPVKTVKGWRTNKVVFVSGVVGKKLVRLTACSEPIREWLLDEVLTYYPNKEADEICSHRFDDGCVAHPQEDDLRRWKFDFSPNGFADETDEEAELAEPVVFRPAEAENKANRTIEQMIDDIIVAALELDRKDYGCQIDRILLGLLDLKRSVIHTKAV